MQKLRMTPGTALLGICLFAVAGSTVGAQEPERPQERKDEAAARNGVIRELEQQINELSQRHSEMIEHLEDAARDGRNEQAADLKQQVARIREERAAAERKLIEAREQTERRPEERRPDGDRPERAARAQAEQERRQRELAERRPEPREGDVADAMQRVRAMHEAAERLSQSGLHDMANELRHRAEDLEREIHARRNPTQEHHPDPAVQELARQMEELRHDVRGLHEKLDHLIHLLERHHAPDEAAAAAAEEKAAAAAE